VFVDLIKEGEVLMHMNKGNARPRKVIRAPGGSNGAKESRVSRKQDG